MHNGGQAALDRRSASETQVTPAHAVLALLLVLLVILPAAVLLIRMAGTRLLGRRPVSETSDAGDVEPLSALELGGFASAAELAALSARERRFVAGAASPRLVNADPPVAWDPAPRADAAPAAAAPTAGAGPADREVPVAAFLLVCPACGATLGSAADVAHYVGSCPGCSRRVATRRRGARVSLTTVDTVPPPTRRPRPRA